MVSFKLKIELSNPDFHNIQTTNCIEGHSKEFSTLLSELKDSQKIEGRFILTNEWKKGIILELILE